MHRNLHYLLLCISYRTTVKIFISIFNYLFTGVDLNVYCAKEDVGLSQKRRLTFAYTIWRESATVCVYRVQLVVQTVLLYYLPK